MASRHSEEDPDHQKSYPTTIVAVGKTGKGKSATLRTILKLKSKNENVDSNYFKSNDGPDSVTDQVKSLKFTPVGTFPQCQLVDTIGLFDTKLTSAQKQELDLKKISEIDQEHVLVLEQFSKVMEISKGGIDAFLFVLSARDRATHEELKTIDIIFRYLGWNMLNYIIFVFTGKDETEEKSFHDWKEYIVKYLASKGYQGKSINDRFIFVDNKNPTKEQATEILDLVSDVVEDNKNKPYTYLAYQAAQHQLEKEKKRIKERLEKQLQEKIDQELKLIQAQFDKEVCNLEKMINKKGAEAAKLKADQAAEKRKYEADIASLKAKQNEMERETEKRIKRKMERLVDETRQDYERVMKASMEDMKKEIRQLREELANRPRERDKSPPEEWPRPPLDCRFPDPFPRPRPFDWKIFKK